MTTPPPAPAGPTGRIVYVPPGGDHTCGPPVRPVLGFVINVSGGQRTEPAAPDGAIWRCGCGRSWTAARTRGTTRGWRRATIGERIKARLNGHEDNPGTPGG